jgi:TonB-linked SusC/RagA family outer membrane protein
MKSLYKIFILICFLAPAKEVFAQKGMTVFGLVFTEDRHPVPDASLYFKRTLSTSGTDTTGRFYIVSDYATDTLVVSHIGYKTVYYAFHQSDQLPMHITMIPSVTALKEVTVSTGYQEISKERSPGSYYKLDNKLINQRVGPDIISRLDGLTSSFLIDKHDVAVQTIQIRGLSTLNYAAATPLIVLDNFPYAGNINNINPNDVESITILKDAAASSIWGARAGNGVIVITTKKAKAGQKLQVAFNSNLTLTQKPNLFSTDQLSVNSTIDLQKYLFNQGAYDFLFSSSSHPPIPEVVEILNRMKLGTISSAVADQQINQLRGQDIKRDLEKYFYRSAVNQQYHLNISGSGSNIRYLLSAGYDKLLNNVRGNDNQRLTLRSNNIIDLTKKWQLQTDFLLTRSNSNTFSLNALGNMSPYQRLVNGDGSPAAVDTYYSGSYTDTVGKGKLLDWKYRPLNELDNNNNKTTSTDILVNLGTTYKVFNWLNADVKYQYQQSFDNNNKIYDLNTFTARDYINRFTQVNNGIYSYPIPVNGIKDYTEIAGKQQSLRGQLSADHAWSEDHQLSAIIGAELRESQIDKTGSRIYGYDPNTLTSIGVDYANPYQSYDNISGLGYIPDGASVGKNLNRFVSVYANAAYTFKNRYTLSGSVRRDASNLFGVATNQKWVPLWSSGALWKIDQEPFYHVSWLNRLNVRATYGISGNLSPNATALTRIQYYPASLNPINIPFVNITSPPNPHLRWEQVRSFNTGLDFSAFSDRISGSVEFYKKNAVDLINSVSLDPTVGFSSANQNSAAIKSKGVDIVLNTLNVNGAFKWRSTVLFNYVSFITTKNLNPPPPEGLISDGTFIFPVLNYNPYIIVSYKWAGLDPATGNPMGYVNGQKSTDYETIMQNPLDQQVISGPAVPPYFGTFRNTLEWNRFSVAVNINYKFGYYFRRPALSYTDVIEHGKGYSEYENRWQKPGDETKTNVPSFIYPADELRDGFYDNADINVGKGDNIRLNDIYLSYDYTPRFSFLGIKSIQFYAYANQLNWILWKSDKSGIDPDQLNNIKVPVSYSAGIKVNL